MQTVLEYVACQVFTMFLNQGLLGRLPTRKQGNGSPTLMNQSYTHIIVTFKQPIRKI